MLAWLSDSLFQMALFAALLASVASGAIGTLVVVKRIAFIAGSISHSILAGLGAAVFCQRTLGLPWPDPLSGALLAALASALLIGWIHLRYRQREDAVIAAIWSCGMALGILFLSFTPGSTSELMSLLFGNILWTSKGDLWLLGSLDAILLLATLRYYHQFRALCFDEEQALLRGIPVQRLYLLLLSLVGVSIVLLIQVIGAILVLALLIIPPTMATLLTSRLSLAMGLAALFAAALSLVGLGCAFTFDLPPSATIALCASLAYFSLLPFRKKGFVS